MQISRPSLLLFSLLLSGQSTAVSQRIPAAEELQGNWQFTEDGQTQSVTLMTVPDKTAEGFQLHFQDSRKYQPGVRHRTALLL